MFICFHYVLKDDTGAGFWQWDQERVFALVYDDSDDFTVISNNWLQEIQSKSIFLHIWGVFFLSVKTLIPLLLVCVLPTRLTLEPRLFLAVFFGALLTPGGNILLFSCPDLQKVVDVVCLVFGKVPGLFGWTRLPGKAGNELMRAEGLQKQIWAEVKQKQAKVQEL